MLAVMSRTARAAIFDGDVQVAGPEQVIGTYARSWCATEGR
jgi:hypothetical protein